MSEFLAAFLGLLAGNGKVVNSGGSDSRFLMAVRQTMIRAQNAIDADDLQSASRVLSVR